jgi:hypothetical protein
MRTTVILSDDLGERFKAQAAAAGISQSDWIRDAIEAALISSDRSEHIPPYPPETDTDALREAITRADKAEADLAAAHTRIAVLEAEAVKDAEHIRSLQSAIATVATAPRPALPDAAGGGKRPWWMFWVPRE